MVPRESVFVLCLFVGWFSLSFLFFSALSCVFLFLFVSFCCLVHLSADWSGAQALFFGSFFLLA